MFDFLQVNTSSVIGLLPPQSKNHINCVQPLPTILRWYLSSSILYELLPSLSNCENSYEIESISANWPALTCVCQVDNCLIWEFCCSNKTTFQRLPTLNSRWLVKVVEKSFSIQRPTRKVATILGPIIYPINSECAVEEFWLPSLPIWSMCSAMWADFAPNAWVRCCAHLATLNRSTILATMLPVTIVHISTRFDGSRWMIFVTFRWNWSNTSSRPIVTNQENQVQPAALPQRKNLHKTKKIKSKIINNKSKRNQKLLQLPPPQPLTRPIAHLWQWFQSKLIETMRNSVANWSCPELWATFGCVMGKFLVVNTNRTTTRRRRPTKSQSCSR